jgi:uncharacterized membrane protein
MLRSMREQIGQAVAYEAGWMLLAAPLYGLLFHQTAAQSALLIMALCAASLVWSPIHNAVFDAIELRLTARVASDRPAALRCLHALSHEASSIVITAPIIMVIGGHGLIEAVAIDIGLTFLDAAYAYGFYLAYDKMRPVRRHAHVRDDAAAAASLSGTVDST